MLRALLFLIAISTSLFAVDPGDTLFNVRNIANNGYVGAFIPKPLSGADGAYVWNGAAGVPAMALWGTGLSFDGSAINVSALPQSSVAGLTSSLSTKANISSLATVATTGDYNDLSNKPSSYGAPVKTTFSAPTLGTTYQPSTTRWATIGMSGRLDATVSLTGSSEAYLLWETCPNSSFAGGTTTEEGRVYNGNGGTLVIGLTLTQKVGAPISFKVDPGYYWRVTQVNITTTGGTPTPTLYAGTKFLEF